MNEMTFEIKNFGPINEAKIDIGKINIIAGQNASGKTTSSKLLYCLLASVSSDGNYLAEKGIKTYFKPLLEELAKRTKNKYPEESIGFIQLSFNLGDMPVSERQLSLEELYKETINLFDNIELEDKNSYKKRLDKILDLIEMKDDTKIFSNIINTLIKMEFDGSNQILDNFNDSTIRFYGCNEGCNFENTIITHKGVSKGILNENYLDCFKVNEISYIETPYIFDFMNAIDYDFFFNKQSNYHEKLLMKKLRDTSSDQNVYDEFMNENIIIFQEKIKKIIEGEFEFDAKTNEFHFDNKGKSFTIKNIAAGLKQLGIIQLLLNNRKLPEDSYLIMDEPEVHLHPEWQIKLAEIIVLLSKELNITIYINSHSPQFIEAIDVYSEYYDLKECTNFYLTEAKNGKFDICKVNNDNLKKIYRNLGDPYKIIDRIQGLNMAKEILRNK